MTRGEPTAGPRRWRDLEPESDIVAALDHAGPRPEDGDQNAKRHWSEKFADGCAVAIARTLGHTALADGKSRILPLGIGRRTEPLIPLSGETAKRIDVTVLDPMLGLTLGISLKGLNFRDARSGNFDKNLTGRLYELADEVRLVHEHLPRAFMVGVFFLPLASVEDKTDKAASGFASTLLKLRERSGRLDPSLAGQAGRCDAAFVGLYATEADAPSVRRGVVRFACVETDPPRRGRPKVDGTLGLGDLVAEIVRRATASGRVTWAEPEAD